MMEGVSMDVMTRLVAGAAEIINDRVVCVDTGRVPTLTLGKVYDAKIFRKYLNLDGNRYGDIEYIGYIGVVDDKGEERNFKSKRFMLLSDWRINKLKEIGI